MCVYERACKLVPVSYPLITYILVTVPESPSRSDKWLYIAFSGTMTGHLSNSWRCEEYLIYFFSPVNVMAPFLAVGEFLAVQILAHDLVHLPSKSSLLLAEV